MEVLKLFVLKQITINRKPKQDCLTLQQVIKTKP